MKITNRKKTGIEEALDDIRNGRIKRYASVDDFFKELDLAKAAIEEARSGKLRNGPAIVTSSVEALFK